MMALQPEARAKERQPMPTPSMTMPTPCATPNDVVDCTSVKMIAEKTCHWWHRNDSVHATARWNKIGPRWRRDESVHGSLSPGARCVAHGSTLKAHDAEE